jgi:hypothetical protein
VLALFSAAPPAALAAFHCMRIHAVMGGYGGNNNIQYVEVRMDTGSQTFVGGHQLKFYSGDPSIATNLKATFTFPANVMGNGLTGDSILIGTSEFNSAVTGGTADFTFTNANTTAANGGDALHPVQSPNGLVHFSPGFDNCDGDLTAGPGEVDSVAYGTTPSFFTTAAPALPSPGTTSALRLNNLNVTPTNNSTEYALTAVPTTSFNVASANVVTDKTSPRNNGRTVLAFAPTGPVGGVSQDPQLVASPDASSGGGGSPWWIYALVAVAAAVACAAIAWRLRAGLFRAE